MGEYPHCHCDIQAVTFGDMNNRKGKLLLALLAVATVILILIQYKETQTSYTRWSDISPFGLKSHLRDKWIVTSSIRTFNATSILGWTILVYGTDKSRCRSPECILLDNELPKYAELLPGNISRENAAYLIAISHRPTFVLTVTELQDEMPAILNRLIFTEAASGIAVLTNKSIIDARSIFWSGKSSFLTASALSLPQTYTFYDYILQEDKRPLVQSVVSPYQLHSGQTRDRQSDYSSHLPPVYLPENTFISLDLEMTLFHHDAFWVLGLKNLSFGHLIAQRLLWEIGGLVMAHSGSIAQTVKYLDTLNPTSRNISYLQLIKNFRCPQSLNILNFSDLLIRLLKEIGLISIRFEETVRSWFFHLKSVGYKFPRRTAMSKPTVNRIKTTYGIISPRRVETKQENIALTQLRMICPKRVLKKPQIVITDIALIISFNYPSLYHNIPLLEAMYKPYFQHIIYCGPNIDTFRLFAHNSSTGHYIFIEAFKRGWYYMFECTVQAMKMNLDVKGYLQIGDDTLLNSWNLEDLPRDRIWLHTGIRSANASLDTLTPNWVWWSNGKIGLNNVIKDILNKTKHHQQNNFEFRFLKNFMNSSRNLTTFYIQGCDFMYVPKRLKGDYIKVTNLLIKHHVMLELGFPNVALGLQSWKDIYFVKDGSIWGATYKNKDIYRTDMVFLHPFKLTNELANQKGVNFFCDIYMGEHQQH